MLRTSASEELIIKNKACKYYHHKKNKQTNKKQLLCLDEYRFVHLIDTENHGTQYASLLGLASRKLSWY